MEGSNTVSAAGLSTVGAALTPYKPKKNINIREVNNGFIIEGGWDNSYIAPTVEEAVKAVSDILSK